MLGAGIAASVLVLAGCVAEPEPVPTTPSGSATVTPSATATPGLDPDGSAADALPYFTDVVMTVWDQDQSVHGEDYIDALTDAGFDRDAMEVTADRTSVDDPADSISFSVIWDDECLVGQVGPSLSAPAAVVLPLLPTGRCLVGDTRAIDG